MGAKDTFPSRLHSLTGANEVEPFFFSPIQRLLYSVLEQHQAAWCGPSGERNEDNKEQRRQLCKK